MPIVSTSTGRAQPNSLSALTTRVVRAVGGLGDPTMEAAAQEAINDALIEINTRLYECNKIGPTLLTLTDGSVDLPAAVYKELECTLVDASGNAIRQLNYIDWSDYQHTFNGGAASASGSPIYYTFFNTQVDGTLKLLPASTGTSYVNLSYYRRFSLLADGTDVLEAPQEIQRVIVLLAQADMLRVFKSGDPQAAGMTRAMAEKAWDRFSAIDAKHSDLQFRFRLRPLSAGAGVFSDIEYVRV